MKKTITLTRPVADLRAFLRNTDADEIIARTTYFRRKARRSEIGRAHV